MTTKQTVLITGASLGIGLELAKLFAASGHDVVLAARSVAKLEALAAELRKAHGIKAHVIGSDLSKPGAAAALYAEIARRGIAVDVLVNNAGYGLYGAFLEVSPEEETQMLQLNMVALTELSRLAAIDMAKRGRGRILNIASTAAFQPGPLMAAYYASKAYVLSLSEALSSELAGQGVTVTALCPGPTRSGFQDKARMHGSRLLTMGLMDAESVARAGYKAVMTGKAVAIPGASNWILAQSVRFMPRCLVRSVSHFVSGRNATAA